MTTNEGAGQSPAPSPISRRLKRAFELYKLAWPSLLVLGLIAGAFETVGDLLRESNEEAHWSLAHLFEAALVALGVFTTGAAEVAVMGEAEANRKPDLFLCLAMTASRAPAIMVWLAHVVWPFACFGVVVYLLDSFFQGGLLAFGLETAVLLGILLVTLEVFPQWILAPDEIVLNGLSVQAAVDRVAGLVKGRWLPTMLELALAYVPPTLLATWITVSLHAEEGLAHIVLGLVFSGIALTWWATGTTLVYSNLVELNEAHEAGHTPVDPD